MGSKSPWADLRWVLPTILLLSTACDPFSTEAATAPSGLAVGGRLNGLPAVAQNGITYDDLLDSVSRRVPAFGGLYQDAEGTIVWLTDPDQSVTAARQALAAIAEQTAFPDATFRLHAGATLRFRKGVYGFGQLQTWRRALYGHGAIPKGTVFTGVNKRLNRLAVAVENERVKAEWMEKLEVVGVPVEAVAFQIMQSPRPLSNLWGKVRPVVGGIQIGSPQTCSLGTGVTYRLDPLNKYFITASHCSVKMWELDPPYLTSGPSLSSPTRSVYLSLPIQLPSQVVAVQRARPVATPI